MTTDADRQRDKLAEEQKAGVPSRLAVLDVSYLCPRLACSLQQTQHHLHAACSVV